MERDNRIDSVRGLLLLIMTTDHLGGPLVRYTNETLGYVTALEGFIFLSAFMFAVVYMKDLDRPRRFLSRVATRVAMLYRYQVALLVAVPLLGLSAVHRHALDAWVHPSFDAPWAYFWRALLLLHQPIFMDILPIYLLFLLISVPVLVALSRGHVKAVLAVSGLLWLWGQHFFLVQLIEARLCADCKRSALSFLAWQLLWVAGLCLGARCRLHRSLLSRNNGVVVAASVVIAVVLFLSRHQFINLGGVDLAQAADLVHLGWLRLLNVAVVTVVMVELLRRLPARYGLPWVSMLGRYSLQVFTFHVLLVYTLVPYRDQLVASHNDTGHRLLTLAALASLTLPAVVYRRYLSRAAARAVTPGPGPMSLASDPSRP